MATIELGASDSDSTVTAQVGDTLAVLLAENATTGYRWHPDEIGELLELVSDGYRTTADDVAEEQRVGRGGTREFRLVATGAGLATLSFKHWREWEGDPSVTERVSYVLDVRP
jgi:inhibitor of cysteine peptidase